MSTSSRSSLKLAPFFQSLSSGPTEHHLYAYMFREDIASGIIPIGGRSRKRPNFKIEIDGTEDNIKNAKILISSFSDRDSRNLTDSFCRAIEEIAKSLSWEATSKFEIMSQKGYSTAHHVSSRRTFQLPLYTIQIVPSEELSIWKRRILYCNNKDIWSISMPKSLGGPRGYRKIIRNLIKVPPGSLPAFIARDMERNINSSIFDFDTYSTEQILFINKVTLSWNWHRRDWSDDKQCEYYRTYKRAMFKYSQTLLREHITVQINKLLKRLDIKCVISVNGLTSSSEIISSVEKLKTGAIKFSEVYDLIYE